MDMEKNPFLPLDEDAVRKQDGYPDSAPSKRRFNYSVKAVLVLLYCVLFTAYIHMYMTTNGARNNVSGAKLQWSWREFSNFRKNQYGGPPDMPGIDASWHELLEPIHLRVSEAEMHRTGQRSIELPDGGQLAWLGVYHQLHCLKVLRHWVYREHYHQNMTESQQRHEETHADHCIEYLRQSAMCNADMSLSSFVWHTEKARPMLSEVHEMHSCVDWDLLRQSVNHRVVPSSELDRLQNPLAPHLDTFRDADSDVDEQVDFGTFDRATDLDSDGDIVYPDVYADPIMDDSPK